MLYFKGLTVVKNGILFVLEVYFLQPVLGGHHVLSGHLAITQG